MAHSPYEMRLRVTMVVAFIKTIIQSKMMNTTTMIPCRRVSWGELAISAFIFKAFESLYA